MKSALPVYPFDPQRCIGTVCDVGPTQARVNLPNAGDPGGRLHFGSRFGAGEVGEFVVLECGEHAIFGRITGVKLPERDRLGVEKELGKIAEVHPVGTVQMLTSIELSSGSIKGGILKHPRLGSSVFSAHPELVARLVERFGDDGVTAPDVCLALGTLPAANDLSVRVTPERLFGRHCAVLGTTGGGKSYTLARLLQEVGNFPACVILLDATGEFHSLGNLAEHVHLGRPPTAFANSTEVVLPHHQLTEMDLVAMFAPSGKVQGPKLRAAIRSLKLARLAPELAPNGIIRKAGQPRRPYEEALRAHAAALSAPGAHFDVTKLPEQLDEECIYETDRNDPDFFGGESGERAFCVGLVTRVTAMLNSTALAPVFQWQGKLSLLDKIRKFTSERAHPVLRISLEHVQFDYNAREIIANAIGRELLQLARKGVFLDQPVVVFLDEAHHFLNRWVGDEDTRHCLDSFELIAKEGRKYWLTICMATQRPRDIPEGVLSQMGTLIVHRLINDRDREVVERASGEIDSSAAAFLPTLAPGEAAVIGVDFPIPLTVQIQIPSLDYRPRSSGPDFQSALTNAQSGNRFLSKGKLNELWLEAAHEDKLLMSVLQASANGGKSETYRSVLTPELADRFLSFLNSGNFLVTCYDSPKRQQTPECYEVVPILEHFGNLPSVIPTRSGDVVISSDRLIFVMNGNQSWHCFSETSIAIGTRIADGTLFWRGPIA